MRRYRQSTIKNNLVLRSRIIQSIRDFFNDHKGLEIPFNWVHPDPHLTETLKVKLVGGEFAHQMLVQQGDGFEGWSFELVEVFDHVVFNP